MKHIKLFENFDEKDGKNWKTAFDAYQGMYLNITDEIKQKIKKELGLDDDNIKFGYNEMQEDRSMWFASILINLDALSDDKKSNFKDIVRNITNPKIPNNAPITKKSGIINKIKGFFSK